MLVWEQGLGGKGAVDVRGSGCAAACTKTLASACGPLAVGRRTATAQEGPPDRVGEALRALVAFLNPLVLLMRWCDKHHGPGPPGTLGGLDHRPLE